MDGKSATATHRRFTIGDGMVLIAATAIGLAWASQAWRVFQTDDRAANPWDLVWRRTIDGVALALPCVLAWTLAWIALRLRRPRPSWRRVSRLPATTALMAAMLSLAVMVPFGGAMVANALMRERTGGAFWRELPAALIELLAMATPFVGFVVLISWLLLAVQRRWRCESSWIDRTGRALGMLWILAGSTVGAEILKRYLS